MLAVLYAVLAAASNAVGAVLQRRAAATIPQNESMHLRLMLDLAKRPIWLGGVISLVLGFLFQASALSVGDLALVQPIVVAELPLTLVVAAGVFHSRIDTDAIVGASCVSAGLALVLLATAPHGGGDSASMPTWMWATAASGAAGLALVLAGWRASGAARATLYGSAAGLGFGFTAALMKSALGKFSQSFYAMITSWELYLMVAVGVFSFFLVQNALQAGSLVAAQPPISTLDPISSVVYGVLLFGEQLRGGIWLLPALVGAVIIVLGSVALSRSPLASGESDRAALRGVTPAAADHAESLSDTP